MTKSSDSTKRFLFYEPHCGRIAYRTDKENKINETNKDWSAHSQPP